LIEKVGDFRMLIKELSIPLSALIAFFFGAVNKLYDDVSDSKTLEESSFEVKFLEVLTACLATLFLLQDFTLSLTFLVLCLVFLSTGQLDTQFWKSAIAIPCITTVLTLPGVEFSGFFDILQRFIFLALTATGSYLENKHFPEESSQWKTWFRVGLVVALVATILLTQSLSSRTFIHSVLYFAVGYFLTGVGFQILNDPSPQDHEVPEACSAS
jgi:hypothetical protein